MRIFFTVGIYGNDVILLCMGLGLREELIIVEVDRNIVLTV